MTIVKGRPDFADHDFGKTRLKKFPPYVYSRLGGMLVHRVREVIAHWYEPDRPHGHNLIRLAAPHLTYVTNCGQTFYGGAPRARRSQTCVIPAPDAVMCGRCEGTGAVFGRALRERKVKRSDARRRIGCIEEVQ